jgi:asparagine synthase (glutamine-hydrolysing)
VADRKKSGYPGSFDPAYLAAIQNHARDVVAGNHPVLDFYDRDEVLAAAGASMAEIGNAQRSGLERFLDVATWLDLHKPTLKLS